MNSKKRHFGSPILINELDKVYGSEPQREEISLRESQDIGKFLEEKEKCEEKSKETKFLFK